MSAPTSLIDRISRSDIEDYLYAEAALLDAWSLDEWLQLFDDDAKYEVPCNDTPDGDPTTDLMLIDDDLTRLKARVERLNSRRAHREYPHSRTNHQVLNVRVVNEQVDDAGQVTELSVSASFTVWRFRGGRWSSASGASLTGAFTRKSAASV